jgi:hypothetical protein
VDGSLALTTFPTLALGRFCFRITTSTVGGKVIGSILSGLGFEDRLQTKGRLDGW